MLHQEVYSRDRKTIQCVSLVWNPLWKSGSKEDEAPLGAETLHGMALFRVGLD